MKVSDLKPLEKNPFKSKGDAQIKRIAKSIQEFERMMEIRRIVIDEDNNILGGNKRYFALKKLGYKEIPDAWIEKVEGLTEDQKKEFIVKDNAHWGSEWDYKLLEEWNVDLDAWGVGEVEFADEKEAKEDDYEIPDENEIKTDIVLGDLIEIGEHRLLCGDSTDSDSVAKLMNGEKADMAHNDPPYGMKKENDGVANDNLNFDDLLDFNRQWIPLSFAMLKDNGSWYCWGIDEPLMDIYSNILKPMAKENKITFRNLITWDKGNGQGQLSSEFRMYPIADEKCLFVQVGVQCLTLNADQYWEEYEPIRKYLYDERIKCGWDIPTMKTIAGHSDKSRDHWTSKSQWNLPTEDVYIKFQNWAREHNIKAFGKQYEELRKQYEELRKQYEELRAYFDNTHDNMNNVWHFDRTSNEEREGTGGHATPKPIQLCERAIKSSCPDNGLVLDVFLGSGSTMVAAHQLKRKCYGMEIEPKYCQIIIDRMRNLDPNLVIKKNGIEI